MAIVAVAVLFSVAIAFRYPVRYRAEIASACAEFDVSEAEAYAVIWTESKFRPNAESRVGARGLMQIMPATGETLCEELGIKFDAEKLYEPTYNIRLGVFYLHILQARFPERKWRLAAYNAGATRAEAWKVTGEITYKETRDYIERVENAARVYRFRGIAS